MRISTGSIVGACLSAAILAACGGSGQTPVPQHDITALGVTTTERSHERPAYGVLYSFKGGTGDGGYPYAGLINVKGTLYGATYEGGTNGDGAVFSVTTS